MFKLSGSFLIFLLWAAGSCARWCEAPERLCNFVCDCSDCSDERECGYNGKDLVCDFEDEKMCGWSDPSSISIYRWERLQGRDSVPTSDYTTGKAEGWLMGVSAVKESSPQTAVLISPEIQQSSPTCQVRLRYYLWDSGLTGLGSAPLWATIRHQDSEEAVVWRPEASSVQGWKKATIFVGRISSPFRIRLHSQRSEGQRGDVAVDQLEFLNCALPLPLPGKECPAGMFKCRREGCVEQKQVCDGTDDCGDGTDEDNCEEYNRCDFEEGTCDWDLRTFSDLLWVRANQRNFSNTDPMQGPGRDHSTNRASGHFLYVTVPDTGLKKNDWASFQSPSLAPTNSSHPCKMVMYTHQFGPRSGGLTVMVTEKVIKPVWERGGSLGDVWVKAEVDIVNDLPFQILIMAAIRNFTYGGIAIDSIQLSPECVKSSESSTLSKLPDSPKDPCAERDKLCDFKADCDGAEDELKCGDFSSTGGSSGWTDTSIGSQCWLLHNSTDQGEYLYVAEASGQQVTDARTQTPLLGPTGPACTMTFDFALTGNADHIGELSVRVMDSLLGPGPKLWEYGGKTGAGEEEWKQADILIGVRKHRFQLAFESRAVQVGDIAEIKVKNVSFHNCYAGYYLNSPTGLWCNFEDGLCGWYQDNNDNFDWTELSGMDHTLGVGSSLVVDMWSPSLRGVFGRLISYPRSPGPTDQCFSFFYKLYGPNTGALNVKLLYKDGHEILLWTRSGSHGNKWHDAECSVPHQIDDFQLVIEAVRSGFDGRVAIDDLALLDRPCRMPQLCSFEGSQCGFISSGKGKWLYLRGQNTTASRPRSDHTLSSSLGFFMLADTSETVVPTGSTTVLTSPIRQGNAKTECVSFWYHMGGEKTGSLTVYMRPVEGNRVKIFSHSLNTADVWRHGNGNISNDLADWQLEFEVIADGGIDSHVAVDDIFLSPHPCEDLASGSGCSLEKGMCSWSNTQDSRVDELDWELSSGQAEQHYLTPPGDHTLGTRQGHFLFLPSGQTESMQRARLLSPHLPSTKGTCLRFWLYKTHPARRQLNVWRLSNGGLSQLLDVYDFGGPWKRFDVNIISSEEYQIVFEGIKTESGVLALDDIEYTIGINCENEVTDFKPKPDNNAGGIAASVLVVLLVIATLMVLLVLYLRSKERARAGPSSSSSSSAASTSSPLARAGFSNETYESDLTQDHVVVPPHTVAGGYSDPVSEDYREVEVK